MSDFVLIHGTTQSPRGWDRLVRALDALGHRGVLVDLAGDDDRSATQYARDIAHQIAGDVTSPVVVAHSGAGLLLPAAARQLGAQRQVWLAAYVPDGRHSLREDVGPDPTAVFSRDWLGQDPTGDPVLATHFLFHDCDLETLRWALTTLRLFNPGRVPLEPVALCPDIPSTYIAADGDRTLRPNWCREAAAGRLGAEVIRIDSGHCPHVSKPIELAAVFDRIARGHP